MKKFGLIFALLAITISANAELPRFMSEPSLSPDAKTIYFSYGGDIYKVSKDGGQAVAVVAMKGSESHPVVSPDGRFLAFSSDVAGDRNVYMVPVEGGDIKQLTYSDATDTPVSWSPDSKSIFFESNRYNSITTYRVAVIGGTPAPLFKNYFNTVVNLVQNPVNGEYLFNESTESYAFTTRKGYVGDHNPNIKSWDAKRGEYKELTSFEGKDIWPMVDRMGNIYYVSSQVNGFDNLMKYDKGRHVALTKNRESLQYPSISFDGSAIVFIKDYRIWYYDVKKGSARELPIEINRQSFENRIQDKIGRPWSISISPDGKKIAYVSRGLLFVCDSQGKFSREIPTNQQERLEEILWVDDSTLIYTRTNGGYLNLYKMSMKDIGVEIPVYTAQESSRGLTISNNRKKVCFLSGSGNIKLYDILKGEVSNITKAEFWSFQSYPLSFSNDDRYLLFSAVNMFERDVFVYDFETKTTVNLTNSANVEDSPVLSKDGKYLFITSNRYSASFPRGASQSLYKVTLDDYADPSPNKQFDALFISKKEKADSSISFNPINIQRRYTPVVRGGRQWNPYVYNTAQGSYLFFVSDHEGSAALYVQEQKEWGMQPPKKVSGLSDASAYYTNGKVLIVMDRRGVYKVDPMRATATKMEIENSFSKSVQDEFKQMFYEVWALLDQNFYDTKFHGVDWRSVRDKYAAYLPDVRFRSDLRRLITDMMGELNSSHLGFSTFGKDEAVPYREITSNTGIIFRDGEPFAVEAIIPGSPASKRGVDIEPGDQLIKVNDTKLSKGQNIYSYFTSPVKVSEFRLTLKRGEKIIERVVGTISTGDMRNLLYTQWEDERRAITEKLGAGKFAYIHMRDMGNESLASFIIDMNTYAVHKEGLILDLRFNNGGNVHKEVIDILNQRGHFRWSYRDKPKATHPNVTPSDKPIIVLVNERSLSDAEVTSNGIKSLSLAKIIGTETYRWIIFTSGAMLVDGSFCRLPSWGCYTMDGKNLEKTGVSPDIYIKNTFKDRLESKDPQLERAIKELLSL